MQPMQPKEMFTVPVAGGELAVARWGGGATTVLALPGITANHVTWTHVASALADDDVTILAPDLRGRGDSGGLPGPYGYQAQVDDLAALLDHLDLDRVVVLGHSGGAFIGTKLTRQHRDRVAALALLDGGLALPVPADTDPDELIEAILGPSLARLSMTFESRDAYQDYWRPHPALSEGWDEVVEGYLDHDIHEADGVWVSKVSEAAVRADGYDALSDEDVHAGLAGIGVPVAFLWAPRGLMNADPLYPREVAEALLADAPDVEVTWLQDCNHYTASLSPDGGAQVADAVRDLLARA